MKIGILTHPLDYNYGCLLQAYALNKTLRSMGHEVITINRYGNPKRSFISQIKWWIIRLALRLLKHQDVSLRWNTSINFETLKLLSSNTQKFVDRNIPNTGIVFPKDLQRVDRKFKFDAYVVGSDQVWLPHFSLNCFLDFVKRENVIRIFYAASSGAKSFADKHRLADKCEVLAKKFSGISVREEALVDIAKKNLGKDAIQVLDPTLLLESHDYINACEERVSNNPVIFTYILDKSEEKQKLIKKVQDDLQLPIINGTVNEDYKPGKIFKDDYIYPSVDNWLLNLQRSKFVITDSFHGTCMSIVFRKPFVVFGNKSRGLNRFLSVLKLFGLEDRLVITSSEFKENFYEALNDEFISETLKKKRTESLNFLKTHLK